MLACLLALSRTLVSAQATTSSTSRVAAQGTGLGVWEVARDFGIDQNADRIRKAFLQLSLAQITAALMYCARYRDEIQARINTNAALTPEMIEKQSPGGVHEPG